jgi:F-type H+-transporting ATPase subunit b
MNWGPLIDRVMDFDIHTLISLGIQLLSAGILIYVLYRILYQPVLDFLDARTKRIADSITNSQEMLQTATAMKAQYEEKLAGIDAERIAILEDANRRAQELETSIVTSARKEADRLKQSALADIELEKQKVKRDMKEQIIDISTLIASRFVSQTIDTNLQNKLLDETIADLGDATWLN